MQRSIVIVAVTALLTAGGVVAQEPPAEKGQGVEKAYVSPVKQERVTEVLGFLASDEMKGRNTPSPELEKAAEFLAAALKKAGLKPVGEPASYFHEYTRPGYELDSGAVRVVVHDADDVVLRPDQDVRVWRANGAFKAVKSEVLRVEGAALQAMRRRLRGSRPIVIEVDETSELWKASAGKRLQLAPRRPRPSPPWLLVRKGVLPEGDVVATVELPEPEARDVALRNVVGVLRGSQETEETVLFTAHYDHIGIGIPVKGDAINNGADDDGTGTTAVLTLAEAFAKLDRRPRRTLAFAFFSGEEKGMLGSRAFAETPPFPLKNVVANVNVEMLGQPWKPRTAWITGHDLSDFAGYVARGMERAGIACAEFPMAAMLFRASDNISFANKGVVAHSISASSLHADYHKPSDEVGTIDFANMTALIGGLYEVGLELANSDQRPAWNDKGERSLGGVWRRRR